MDVKDLMPSSDRAARGRAPSVRRMGMPSMFALQDEMNRRFEELWRAFEEPMGLMARGFGRSLPSVDVAEDERAVRVTAELPGMDEKDVEVTFTDGVLGLRGEKRAETERKDERYHVTERTFGSFERSIPIGRDIDQNEITAEFRNGVLTITLPKAAEAQKPAKRIAINAGKADNSVEMGGAGTQAGDITTDEAELQPS